MATEEMHMLINHVQECTQFTIDTESEKSDGQLALIQLQTIPPRLPSLVVLIELAHLPSNDSQLYVKIKEFFELIFRSNNELYSWGDMIKELDPIKNSELFTWPTLAPLINIQPYFSGWYEWALTHSESYCPKHHLDDVNNVNVMPQNYLSSICYCPRQSPYRPGELWSLQNALIYSAQLLIDKSIRVNNWAGGLTIKNSTLSSSRRQNMIKYAIYDVFSTTYLIRPILENWTFEKLKNTKIHDLFISFMSTPLPPLPQKTKKIKKNINTHKFVNALFGDDNLEPISDDEIYVSQLVGLAQQTPPDIEEIVEDTQQLTDELPTNDIELIISEDNELIINNDEQVKPAEDREQQPSTTKHKSTHQQRTKEARSRRNRKRNNTLRMRRYQSSIKYKIYYRFTMKLIKEILRTNEIKHTHVKVADGLLIIGFKNEMMKQKYQQQLSEELFTRHTYYQQRRHRQHHHEQ